MYCKCLRHIWLYNYDYLNTLKLLPKINLHFFILNGLFLYTYSYTHHYTLMTISLKLYSYEYTLTPISVCLYSYDYILVSIFLWLYPCVYIPMNISLCLYSCDYIFIPIRLLWRHRYIFPLPQLFFLLFLFSSLSLMVSYLNACFVYKRYDWWCEKAK